ncbi:MAG: hypothetical protein AAF403_06495 [Pseudomonadota bacterium]
MIDIVATQFELYSLARTSESNPDEALRRYRNKNNLLHTQTQNNNFANQDLVKLSPKGETRILLSQLHKLLQPKLDPKNQELADQINEQLHRYFSAFDQEITEGEFKKLESLQFQIEQLEFLNRPLNKQERVYLQNLIEQEENLIKDVDKRLPENIKVNVESLENQLHAIFADSFAVNQSTDPDPQAQRIEAEIDNILESALNDDERIRLDLLFSKLEEIEKNFPSNDNTNLSAQIIDQIDELERQISALFEKARARLNDENLIRLESLTVQLEFHESGLRLNPQDQARAAEITIRIDQLSLIADESQSKTAGNNSENQNQSNSSKHLLSLQI